VTPRLRVLIGGVTVLVWLGVGGSLFAGGRTWIGAVLMALGAFRAVVLVRQTRAVLQDPGS
jgi:hypothetical protein